MERRLSGAVAGRPADGFRRSFSAVLRLVNRPLASSARSVASIDGTFRGCRIFGTQVESLYTRCGRFRRCRGLRSEFPCEGPHGEYGKLVVSCEIRPERESPHDRWSIDPGVVCRNRLTPFSQAASSDSPDVSLSELMSTRMSDFSAASVHRSVRPSRPVRDRYRSEAV